MGSFNCRRTALALIAAGRSMSQVFRELGEWKKQLAGSPSALPVPEAAAASDLAALTAEVSRLRKSLAQSELQADILKIALAIVGQLPADFSR